MIILFNLIWFTWFYIKLLDITQYYSILLDLTFRCNYFLFPIQGCLSILSRSYSEQTDLKDILAGKIAVEQERVKKFRKESGNVKIGEITVDMVNDYYSF